MDRARLIHDAVRAYIVALGLTLSFFLVAVAYPEEFDLLSVAFIWYQLTGLGILLVVTYRAFNQPETSPTVVGVLFFLWTAFLESLFVIYSATGQLSGVEEPTSAGYTVAIVNNAIFFVQLLLTVTISGALFVIAVLLLRLMYTTVSSPATKAVFYPVIFGLIIVDIIGLALLSPLYPDTFTQLSVVVARWIKFTLLSPLGIAEWFGSNFNLTGINYLLLWVGIDLSVAWSFTFIDVAMSYLNKVPSQNP